MIFGFFSIETKKVKAAPYPTSDSTLMSPLRRFAIFLQMERPRPTPLGLRWALLFRVPNSWKRLHCSSFGIPTPVSFIEMNSALFLPSSRSSCIVLSDLSRFKVRVGLNYSGSPSHAVTVIVPSCVNLMELESKFIQTC